MSLALFQELEKVKRRLEAEVADLKEQLAERNVQMDDQQAILNKREEELQQTLNKSVIYFMTDKINNDHQLSR